MKPLVLSLLLCLLTLLLIKANTFAHIGRNKHPLIHFQITLEVHSQPTIMVIISKLVGRFLGVSAIISVPGGNAFGLFAQGRSLPGYAELQSLNSEWTAGVVKAFEDNGATLQEVTGTEYAEIWAILANEEQPTGEEKKGKKTKADKTKGKKTKGEKTKNERDKWYKIKWEDLPNILKAWIIANPWQSAFIVVNGVVFFAPAAASGPVLWIFGFTSTGPRAGE